MRVHSCPQPPPLELVRMVLGWWLVSRGLTQPMPSPGCCPAWPSCGCFLGAEGGEGLFPLVGLGEAVGGVIG